MSTTPVTLQPAAYLRCHHGNAAALPHQREALRRLAVRLAVPAPVFYEDRIRPDTDPALSPPRFEDLTRAIMDGAHRLLFVPGPWTLAGSEARIRIAVRLLTAAGCARIITLPAALRPVRRRIAT
ncbi:hypothetical protein GCM10010441_26460 [Kitasatospora paracochleata]|uniref:Resolvase/invertase-type recombinase catalytic domain-containing protein n=1 Tax=Kitasatospora paracochleata TaxID=58354 RepID=A0ABT1IW47_9ACTN|nr:hypothetical protein [Kitasatospora paracochleata]MCP2309366.1 hypothetical protein [Kitasatospora paracochleata]